MPVTDKIAVTPMLRMAIPLSAGIVLAGAVTVPTWFLAVIAAACYVLGWAMYRSMVGRAYVFCAVLVSGVLFARLHSTENRIPTGTRMVMTGEVLEIPKTSGRWQRAKTRITMFRQADMPVNRSSDPVPGMDTGPNLAATANDGRRAPSGYNKSNNANTSHDMDTGDGIQDRASQDKGSTGMGTSGIDTHAIGTSATVQPGNFPVPTDEIHATGEAFSDKVIHATERTGPAYSPDIPAGGDIPPDKEDGLVTLTGTGTHPQPSWHMTDESVILCVDTCYRIDVGDLVGVRGYFNRTDSSKRSFAALMKARGITGYVYVVPTGLLSRAPHPRKSASYYAARVQGWAVERIMLLKCDSATRAMTATLVAGDKRFLSKATNAEYSKVGASHILAVSGLHMSFVFVMVNLLLVLVTLTPRGHIIKNGIVILTIWLYALMSGLAPSAVRAAIMLSAVQLSLGLSAGRNSYNILFGTAVVMLAINPYYLFDVGFQLSFMAVLSILFFLPRMVRWLPLRSTTSRKTASVILIGFAAQVGVMPILAYNFGSIPLMGLLISPVISYTAFAIIAIGLIWVIAPIGFLSGITGGVLEFFVTLQNELVARTAVSPYAAADIPEISGTGVIIIYFAIFAICFAIELWEDGKQKHSTAKA